MSRRASKRLYNCMMSAIVLCMFVICMHELVTMPNCYTLNGEVTSATTITTYDGNVWEYKAQRDVGSIVTVTISDEHTTDIGDDVVKYVE